ncbi:hypothetical protein EYF80_037134 [Liparis tanakae]|uniref:Uncharacterized protein n=1 Tax=Liparis tanakae TaxID=230148 RepID=A0A4Z2GIJ8_9TELE|nr:hypothetical protein EYF80_037134 [Liparis tanakae]
MERRDKRGEGGGVSGAVVATNEPRPGREGGWSWRRGCRNDSSRPAFVTRLTEEAARVSDPSVRLPVTDEPSSGGHSSGLTV